MEFMHISDRAEQDWLMKEFEQLQSAPVSKAEQLEILEELTKSETFNSFLNDKLKTSKRFGLEGLDSLISGLSTMSTMQTSWWRRRPIVAWSISVSEWHIEGD